MTRQEYDQKREAGANAGFTEIATYINDSMIKDEYIESLEAEVEEYKAVLDRVLGAHKKAIARLMEWSPELAHDFVTLLLMDLQKKEEM